MNGWTFPPTPLQFDNFFAFFGMHTVSFVFATLFPIYAMLILGVVLRRSEFMSEEVAKGLNKLIFWVALPCMIVRSISTANVTGDWLPITTVLVLATLLIAAVAWIVAPFLGISSFSRPSFCQSVFRSNNAYVGIPVMCLAFTGRPDYDQLAALAAITLAPCLITYNVMAVILLTPKDQSAPLGKRLLKVVKGVFKNPLILACLIGLGLLFLRKSFHIELFGSAAKTIDLLGKMATPGSLIALGSSLSAAKFKAAFRSGHWAAFLKLVICPLGGLLLATLFGLSPLSRFVVLGFLACPCAVASFVMAQAMKGDAELSGAAVALSTVYSAISLSILLATAMPPLPN